MKHIFLLCIFFLSFSSLANNEEWSSDTSVSANVYVGTYYNEALDDIGFELGVGIPFGYQYIQQQVKFSVSIHEARSDYYNNDFYESVSASYHVGIGDILMPQFGIGLMLGNTMHCDEEDDLFTCNEDYIAAIYPEASVTLKLGNLHFVPFVRRYFDTTESDASNSVGLMIQLSF